MIQGIELRTGIGERGDTVQQIGNMLRPGRRAIRPQNSVRQKSAQQGAKDFIDRAFRRPRTTTWSRQGSRPIIRAIWRVDLPRLPKVSATCPGEYAWRKYSLGFPSRSKRTALSGV